MRIERGLLDRLPQTGEHVIERVGEPRLVCFEGQMPDIVQDVKIHTEDEVIDARLVLQNSALRPRGDG